MTTFQEKTQNDGASLKTSVDFSGTAPGYALTELSQQKKIYGSINAKGIVYLLFPLCLQ